MQKLKDVLSKEKEENESSSKSQDIFEYEKQRAEWYNESKGKLNLEDGIDCHVCKNKGSIQYVNDKGYSLLKECECMKKRRSIIRIKNSGLGTYINKRFPDYVATEEWQKTIKSSAINYCKNIDNEKKWFVMLGQSGAGKTLIASIICNYLLIEKNMNVIYVTWTDFISKLKRDMMSDESKLVSSYFEETKNAEVLFIDELLKKFNETDLKYAIEILNYRYQNNLITIITSENTIDDLMKIDESVMGRMCEKADEYLIVINKDKTKNYRMKGITL